MKKNRLFMLGLVSVFVAVLSLTLVSSTFARYTSTVTGQDSARVAKWAFTYKNSDGDEYTGVEQSIEFDLFNTIKDSNGTDNETDVDVDGNGTETVIAPGTSGSFTLTFTNASEVTAQYKIDYTLTLNSVPIEFKVGEGEWGTLEDVTTPVRIEMNQTASITIQWSYPIGTEGSDNEHAGKNVSVQATIVWDQVD